MSFLDGHRRPLPLQWNGVFLRRKWKSTASLSKLQTRSNAPVLRLALHLDQKRFFGSAPEDKCTPVKRRRVAEAGGHCWLLVQRCQYVHSIAHDAGLTQWLARDPSWQSLLSDLKKCGPLRPAALGARLRPGRFAGRETGSVRQGTVPKTALRS